MAVLLGFVEAVVASGLVVDTAVGVPVPSTLVPALLAAPGVADATYSATVAVVAAIAEYLLVAD